jgi:hypothetical protein
MNLKFKDFRITLTFNLNLVFKMNFLKIAFVRVRFSHGFLSGAGFSAEQIAPV